MKKYSWKNCGFKADAQIVGEELEKLESKGELNSNVVLDYAKQNKNSELSKCFEWDNNIAGEKYRQIQATQVLCSISYVIEKESEEKQRVYVSIRTKDETRQFKNIMNVLEEDEEYKQLIDKAKKELESCTEKYNNIIKKQDIKEILFELYRDI